MFEFIVDKYVGSIPCKQELIELVGDLVKKRVVYRTLFRATSRRPLRIDNASYKGLVEVQEPMGRRRGLFTTRSVNASELFEQPKKEFTFS